ncbi:MAG: hypothetical protein HC780_09430 [Leptolyngbyaceae cyanobacterium CSU_1_3]|nr:hypothetical protein [Leptolyngbyaceae cyanobacterium CSU_1_3]
MWGSFAIALPAWSLPIPSTYVEPDSLDAALLTWNTPIKSAFLWNHPLAKFITEADQLEAELTPLTLQQTNTSSSSQASEQTAKFLSDRSQISYRAVDLQAQPIPEGWFTIVDRHPAAEKAIDPTSASKKRDFFNDFAQSPELDLITANGEWNLLSDFAQSPELDRGCWFPSSAQKNCSFTTWPGLLSQAAPVDSELGTLELRQELRPGDPELGTLQLKPLTLPAALDPELGNISPLQEIPIEKPPAPTVAKQPSVYLLARADYFKTSNVFSGVDPVGDGLIRSGLTLFYAPAIGSRTYLITSIDANLIRYTSLGSTNNRIGTATFGSLNYNELRFRAGIWQQFSPRMSGEIGWSNQQLFTTREGLKDALRGDRFLNDHSIRLELSRQDPLSSKLSLSTFYQFRASFADPRDRNRLINSLIASLSYTLSPSLQTALDYQVAWSHFTQQPRDDVYHQLVGRLTYTVTPQSQLNLFGGFSFGSSSDSSINFDGVIFGVGLVINAPLF